MTTRPKRHRRTPPGRKEQRPVIRVLTEGKITEREYLRLVKGNQVHLDFANTDGLPPLALVKQARRDAKVNRRTGEFDQVWCLFDRDEHADAKQALHEARQSGLPVGMSNPCFELWLVLHVEDQHAHVHRMRCSDDAKHSG